MVYNKYSVRKYFVSTTVATAFVFSSMLAGGASAYGGPDTEATEASQNNENNSSVTEQEQERTEQKKQTESASVSKGNLTKGDSGDAVKELQTSLQDKGQTAQRDGIFGGETEKAVKNVQSNNGLAVDGIVGPKTKPVLLSTDNTETTETTETTESAETNENTDKNENTNNVTNEEEGTSPEASKETVENTSTADNSDVVSVANSLVDKPYTAGGTTPAGFDSSGFINYAFNQVGISLDRTHASMWANNGVHVDSPSVGDVVFFENTYKSGVSHSGIYLGDNQMVHAGTSKTGVEITTMSYDYWQDRYKGAKSFN